MTEPPRARNIGEVAAPYENFLVPMPAPAADVCPICHSSVFGGYPRCYPCKEAGETFGAGHADAVASVALAVNGAQLARNLYLYKDLRVQWAVRQPIIWGLAAVLYKWLSLHEPCLARAAGLSCSKFDVVTLVPSTSGRIGTHPLETLLTGVVAGSRDRYADLLRVNRPELDARTMAVDRFVANSPVTGSVLIIDDAWVTGAKPQAAAAALKAVGASSVAILTIGRWFTTDYEPNIRWLRDKRAPGWNWSTCCLH